MFAFAFALAASSALTGCVSEGSVRATTADEETAALSLGARVRSNGRVAQALVSLAARRGAGQHPVTLGPQDKLLFAVPGGKEIPFQPLHAQYVAQLETTATRLLIVLLRGRERIESVVELPPPFALSAELTREPAGQRAISISWSPGAPGASMMVECHGDGKRAALSAVREGAGPGAAVIPFEKLQRAPYFYGAAVTEQMIVSATRMGGSFAPGRALSAALVSAEIEQIREVVAAPAAEPKPASPDVKGQEQRGP